MYGKLFLDLTRFTATWVCVESGLAKILFETHCWHHNFFARFFFLSQEGADKLHSITSVYFIVFVIVVYFNIFSF